jgi:hypothetical protein
MEGEGGRIRPRWEKVDHAVIVGRALSLVQNAIYNLFRDGRLVEREENLQDITKTIIKLKW